MSENEKRTGAVIVAIPAEEDPIHGVSSEAPAHMTLIWMGNDVDLSPEQAQALDAALAGIAADTPALTLTATSRAELGDEGADVLMLEPDGMAAVREALLADETIRSLHDAVEQYPQWTPHLTLGYPDTPALGEPGETVTFDHLALLRGSEHSFYPLAPAEGIVAAAAEEETVPEEEDSPPFVDGAAVSGFQIQVPWHGILAVEDVWTGDHRRFLPGALTYRELPVPLTYQEAETDGHDGARIVARIDKVVRRGNVVWGGGLFDVSSLAGEAVRLVADEFLRGVSVRVDDAVAEYSESEDGEIETSFSQARIATATLVTVPAYAEAYVALGPLEESEAFLATAPTDEEFAAEGPWDGSASRFTPQEWKRSCIIHVCDGEEKSCHKLPIREPGGALSRAGVHAAAARINQVDAPPDQISAAKGHLRGAYKELGETPPDSVAAGESEAFADAPGLHKDGTPPVCKYCSNPSTKYVLWAEGMAYVPACEEHIEKAEAAIEDPSDIVRIGEYSFAPAPAKTRDGPGWITDPEPTKRITDYWVDGTGAAKIGWGAPGDFERCRTNLAQYVQNPEWLAGLCANLHHRALRTWPGKHGAAAITAAATTLSAADFANPNFTEGTPLTVTEDGRVYGHLALWGTCHIGFADECVDVPRSRMDYSLFHTGAVRTDAGDVAVGQITLGGGHAGLGNSIKAALEHYDATSSVVADVRVGEDDFGIWFAGRLRPGVSEEKIAELRAAPLSGDWRLPSPSASHLELVAAHAVVVPGFPVPRPSVALAASGMPVALVAAGNVAADLHERAIRARAELRLARARRGREKIGA